ncbi:S41 family peptidase [Hufsiella ginkgonis]|uniref:PDZ domain-containing protein n=1 Tax=Hufsiella ginkgonis TaxID=2695274 RepID=A0A7K1XZY9_9SPHI|nr:S41 family peptidase [Hufsiella ginkgonis]MXV16309.1 hypothetical protein [Hufsiella ginkgonis]
MMKSFTCLKLAMWCLLVTSLVATSCKKDKKNKVDPAQREALTKDSIYLYAQQTYLWNTALPTYEAFNPRKYTSNDAELLAITRLTLNPATGKNYEYDEDYPDEPKYSFIDDGTLASAIGGTAGDYGFSVFFNSTSDLRVKYVYPNSPAAALGLKRGYQIIKLNGSTDLTTTTNASINFIVNAIFGSAASVTMTVKKPDNSTQDVVVTRGSYTINPILFTNVYTEGGKKIGYIVFNSFTLNVNQQLIAVFADFASKGVTELIIDLRYNGGGAVDTSELLANLIVPASANNTAMYSLHFNQLMQSGNATILKNQKYYDNGVLTSAFDESYAASDLTRRFAKIGSLNVNRCYFIVTGGTASASELLINNLKPLMDVQLIGNKTYGKPVGFFAITIDKLDLYIPQFESKNSLGQGGYYDGIAVNKEDNDDLTKEFGDTSEKLLAYALTYARKGTFAATNSGENSVSSSKSTGVFTVAEAARITKKLDRNEFKGMVIRNLKVK